MSDIKFLICKCCGAWHDDGSKEYCFKCLELSDKNHKKQLLFNYYDDEPKEKTE